MVLKPIPKSHCPCTLNINSTYSALLADISFTW